MSGNDNKKDEQITIKQNPHFPGIEVKLGENQFSRHSHIHQAWSLSYVLNGRTTVSLGTRNLELSEDMFIAVPPGVPHLCSPCTETHFSFAVLYLPSGLLDTDVSAFSEPRVGKGDTGFVLDMINRFMHITNQEELDNQIQELQSMLGQKSSVQEDNWGSNLLDRELDTETVLPSASRFQQYRYTRKHYGISRKKISTIERMEQAKELMAEGQVLSDIALSCGFYDQSHFSKVFKLYTGLTPAQYMKK